ncbi:hypothetical protein GCWU000342_01388 [Shuttleworthella satelles DSM 14600]|uniref:Uncharacterized protein n=1 Tax=Shuttleworthella satelles DSM 14600 TaxID=626523 RepID=C4GBT6_9FIRM|nr:hypothetical protein GCWU000342_01388 [Shuttleworthia satelles DSM 14600]
MSVFGFKCIAFSHLFLPFDCRSSSICFFPPQTLDLILLGTSPGSDR